jgi:glycosyltransferase involved in cell wall biosynthesis
MGLDTLVLAFASVAAERPDLRLVIGGKGPLAGELEAQVRCLGLQEKVSLVGFIPEERLASYYAAADLFVLPTRMLEGFGLVTVEAMACGTPVCGTPVGGTQEILAGFDAGWLFRGTEAAELRDGLLDRLPHVVSDAELRARCREHAVANYSWDVLIPRLERLFFELADGERRAKR